MWLPLPCEWRWGYYWDLLCCRSSICFTPLGIIKDMSGREGKVVQTRHFFRIWSGVFLFCLTMGIPATQREESGLKREHESLLGVSNWGMVTIRKDLRYLFPAMGPLRGHLGRNPSSSHSWQDWSSGQIPHNGRIILGCLNRDRWFDCCIQGTGTNVQLAMLLLGLRLK